MLDGSEPGAGRSGGAGDPPRVLLAGSFVSFSDRVLSVLGAEFPGFRFHRIDEAALAHEVGHEVGCGAPLGRTHLLVCEEGAAAAALDVAAAGQAHVAVAFRDAGSIAARMIDLGACGVPMGLSLLPMNVRLDAWLSIMGLLLQGETYVPVEVFRRLSGPREAWARTGRAPDRRATAGGGDAFQAGGAVDGAGDWARDWTRLDLAPHGLTNRERRVLPLIAQGKQNKVIASELAVSEHTVKLHVHNIIGKLGVRNRTEAARRYLARPAPREGA